eukprot:jgi/Ulvmu1/7206/UM034_0115.1
MAIRRLSKTGIRWRAAGSGPWWAARLVAATVASAYRVNLQQAGLLKKQGSDAVPPTGQ